MTPAGWMERMSPEAALLAEAVSPAVRIEPQLLRKMRLELFPGFDAGVEADLWFSPVVETRTASGIVLRQDAAEVLRRRLGEKPEVLESAWTVIETLHRSISPAVFAEERLAYLALAGKQDEMRALLRSVVATLVSPRGRGLADWAAKAIARLPEEARALEEAQMLAFGASLRLGAAGPAGAESSRASEWAAWLSPEDLELVPFGVALLEDAVEFGPVGRPGSHRIELPKTSPVVAELRWSGGSGEVVRRATLSRNTVTVVEVDAGVTEVDIRTVLGDSYWLTVRQKLDRVRRPGVRIAYDVAVGGTIEKKELPFVVGVLADFTAYPVEELPPVRERRFVEVTTDNFDEVMKASRPRLTFTVENRLGPDSGELAVELRFESLRDFEPAAVARQIDAMRGLLRQRSVLDEMTLFPDLPGLARSLGPAINSGDVESAVRELESAYKVPRDRGREMVAVLSELKGPPMAGVQERIAEIDAMLSAQMREILHHPDFQRLESTWRSLYYLVQRTETSGMLKIRALNVTKRELASDPSVLFRNVYQEQFGFLDGAPFGVLVGDYEFGPGPEDVELLEGLARVAAAAHAPFLAQAMPAFFRLDSFRELDRPRDLAPLFESSEMGRWRDFRESEDARYMVLTVPRMLLRLPYGNSGAAVEEFPFEELESPAAGATYVWGSPAFALAARITDAFATYGWCAAIRGVEGGGLVEGLPAFSFATDDGEVALQCPTEVPITDRREKELADLGFVPLVHCKNTDYAAFFSVSTVQRPGRFSSPEGQVNPRVAVQLPYVLAVSRFAHYLQSMTRDRIGFSISREELEAYLNRWIAQYVVLDDRASESTKAKFPLREARIEVEDVPDRPGTYRAVAYLRPHFQLDELTGSLRVAVDLPGLAS